MYPCTSYKYSSGVGVFLPAVQTVFVFFNNPVALQEQDSVLIVCVYILHDGIEDLEGGWTFIQDMVVDSIGNLEKFVGNLDKGEPKMSSSVVHGGRRHF